MRIHTNSTWIPRGLRVMYPRWEGVLFDVDENEPVYSLQESYALNREGNEEHRWQVMTIPKGNVLSTFWTDLGPSSFFKMHVEGVEYQAPPYHQIVLMEHSVAECQDMAEIGRMDDFAVRLLHEQVNESDLFERYAQLIEQDLMLVRNRSSFGPFVSVQRGGYSAVGAQEQGERIAMKDRFR